ncbi:MAG: PulJ/GspJ family protein [Paraclostridium sp.]
MKKINSKGFTILEVIIAMSILSVVVLMGYKIINGTEQSISNNKVIYEGQLNTNLVNKYLTNDIERSIEPPKSNKYNNTGEENVLYTNFIEGNGTNKVQVDKVEYKVITRQISETNDKKWEYDLNRIIYEKNGEGQYIEKGDINLISKQPYYKENNSFKPFEIKHGDGIYTVTVNYQENKNINKNNTVYEFEVSSRVNGSKGDIIEEKTPDGNIVVHNKKKTIDTVINEKTSQTYNQKIKMVKYKDSSKVEVIIFNENKLIFENNKISLTIGNETKEFTPSNTTGTVFGKNIKVSFKDGGSEANINIDDIRVLIESTINKSEIELFEDTENEVDIEIKSNGKVNIEIGDHDDRDTYGSDDEDIDVELEGNHGKNIKKLELKVLNTKINKTSKETFNPAIETSREIENKYYNQSKNEFDMELYTDGINEGSYVVINFTKDDSTTPDPPPVEPPTPEIPQLQDLKYLRVKHTKQGNVSYIELSQSNDNSIYNKIGKDLYVADNNGKRTVDVKIDVAYTEDKEALLTITLDRSKTDTINLGKVKVESVLRNDNGIEYKFNDISTISFTTKGLNTGHGSDENREILTIKGTR